MKSSFRATLSERTYEELQRQIVLGLIPPGKRLLPDEIAGELQISQTPVKEALALLQRDGLVESRTRQTPAVRRFTRNDIIEVYEGRILIERHALTVGVKEGRITAAILHALTMAHEKQSAHAAKRNAASLARAIGFDRQFHATIVGLAENRMLQEWHRTVLNQTQTIRTHSLDTYPSRSSRDHAAIIEALSKGDVRAAIALLEDHLLASRDGLLLRHAGTDTEHSMKQS